MLGHHDLQNLAWPYAAAQSRRLCVVPEQRAIPDYRSVAGNLSVQVLRRDAGDVTHFLTVTLWESEQAIRGFAGDELLVAKYYPEDAEYLLEFEREVQHFAVSALAPGTGRFFERRNAGLKSLEK